MHTFIKVILLTPIQNSQSSRIISINHIIDSLSVLTHTHFYRHYHIKVHIITTMCANKTQIK